MIKDVNMLNVDIIELTGIVEATLDMLYKNEITLFNCDISERSVVFYFGKYLIEQLEKYDKYNDYNVDFEYNRNILDEKTYKQIVYEGLKQKCYPDIILHKRGSNDYNILAIEFKKENNTDKKGRKNDDWKLRALTDKGVCYKYKLGLFIDLGLKRNRVKVSKYIEGKKIE